MKSEKYDDLSREELVRLLQRREKEPQQRFGLVWEQNDLKREASINAGMRDRLFFDLIRLCLRP